MGLSHRLLLEAVPMKRPASTVVSSWKPGAGVWYWHCAPRCVPHAANARRVDHRLWPRMPSCPTGDGLGLPTGPDPPTGSNANVESAQSTDVLGDPRSADRCALARLVLVLRSVRLVAMPVVLADAIPGWCPTAGVVDSTTNHGLNCPRQYTKAVHHIWMTSPPDSHQQWCVHDP